MAGQVWRVFLFINFTFSCFFFCLCVTVPGFPWRGAMAPWMGIYTEGQKNRSKSLLFGFFSCHGNKLSWDLGVKGRYYPRCLSSDFSYFNHWIVIVSRRSIGIQTAFPGHRWARLFVKLYLFLMSILKQSVPKREMMFRPLHGSGGIVSICLLRIFIRCRAAVICRISTRMEFENIIDLTAHWTVHLLHIEQRCFHRLGSGKGWWSEPAKQESLNFEFFSKGSFVLFSWVLEVAR